MVTVILILSLEATTVTFQSTAGATMEWQWSNSSSISNCLYPLWVWLEIFSSGVTAGVTVEQQQFNFELFVDFLGLTWNIHFFFCFLKWVDSQFGFWTTLDSVRISKWADSVNNRVLDNFRFSPNFEMGWFPIQILDNFRFSPNWE